MYRRGVGLGYGWGKGVWSWVVWGIGGLGGWRVVSGGVMDG